LAALRQPLSGTATAPETVKEKGAEAASVATVVLDPERTVDPNLHGSQLANLHQATIETENEGRNFAQVLEKEVEPAIKELSSCLLYPGGSLGSLDTYVEKFENAIHSMRSAQRSLQSCIKQVRALGEQLFKT
jgi:hypothetical protein